ncbi:hypothetical protein [Thermosphaera sp.]
MFEYSLYIDADRPGGRSCLLEGKTSAPLGDTPRVVQADAFVLKLYFRKRMSAGSPSTPAPVSPSAIILAAKRADDLSATTLLFSAADFSPAGEGDDRHYEAILNLHTPEMDAAFGTDKTMLARVDIELQNADNTRRLTYQFDLTVVRQVYGGEATPTPGTPPYPHPSLIITKIRGTINLDEGSSSATVENLGLGAPPAQVLLTLRTPSAEAPMLACAVAGAPTADGFVVVLSAPTPSVGYKLDWLVIP